MKSHLNGVKKRKLEEKKPLKKTGTVEFAWQGQNQSVFSIPQLNGLLQQKITSKRSHGIIFYQDSSGFVSYDYYRNKIVNRCNFYGYRWAMVSSISESKYATIVHQAYLESPHCKLVGVTWDIRSNTVYTFQSNLYRYSNPLITCIDEITVAIAGENSTQVSVVNIITGTISREIDVPFHINFMTKSKQGVLITGETYNSALDNVVIALFDKYGKEIDKLVCVKENEFYVGKPWCWCLELNDSTWVYTNGTPIVLHIYDRKEHKHISSELALQYYVMASARINDRQFAVADSYSIMVCNDIGACLLLLLPRESVFLRDMRWIDDLGLLCIFPDGAVHVWNEQYGHSLHRVVLPGNRPLLY